jgi:hypothetical protein
LLQIKLQQLEQQLVVARARESADEQEKRRRDESHLALLQTRSELKDSEARALAEEKLQKQLLAEQKEKKLQELREKWVVSVAEPSARAKGKADKEGKEGGSKKRRRGDQKSQPADEGDDEGDEEDDALMRSLNTKGTIDFGSSDEEEEDSDGDAPTRTLRTRNAAPAPADDLFGDSDDEVDAAKAPAAVLSDGDDAQAAAPVRKRLKKANGSVSQLLGSSDEEEGGDDEMMVAAEEGKARKQQRIIDDDSD